MFSEASNLQSVFGAWRWTLEGLVDEHSDLLEGLVRTVSGLVRRGEGIYRCWRVQHVPF